MTLNKPRLKWTWSNQHMKNAFGIHKYLEGKINFNELILKANQT